LLAEVLQLSFGRSASIALPTITVTTPATYVKPGDPIPVRQYRVDPNPPLLEPRYVPAITTATHEMLSSGNAQTLLSDALARAIGLALDQTAFDSNLDDGVRPSGLRAGIAPSTASSATAPEDACLADVATLINGTAVVANNSVPFLIVAPGRAIMLQHYLVGADPMPRVLRSTAIGVDDMLAIVPHAIVAAADEVPQIEVARETSVHYDDAPLPIVGDSGVAAAVVGSLFQSDVVAIKARLQCVWARRHPASVAWLTATGWK
jgi:hypothetical protein